MVNYIYYKTYSEFTLKSENYKRIYENAEILGTVWTGLVCLTSNICALNFPHFSYYSPAQVNLSLLTPRSVLGLGRKHQRLVNPETPIGPLLIDYLFN